jgi:hypothetical protein
MKEIKATLSYFCNPPQVYKYKVDDEDYEWLSQHKWGIHYYRSKEPRPMRRDRRNGHFFHMPLEILKKAGLTRTQGVRIDYLNGGRGRENDGIFGLTDDVTYYFPGLLQKRTYLVRFLPCLLAASPSSGDNLRTSYFVCHFVNLSPESETGLSARRQLRSGPSVLFSDNPRPPPPPIG